LCPYLGHGLRALASGFLARLSTDTLSSDDSKALILESTPHAGGVTAEDDIPSSSPTATILSKGPLIPQCSMIPDPPCPCTDLPLPFTDPVDDDGDPSELYEAHLGGSIPLEHPILLDPDDVFPFFDLDLPIPDDRWPVRICSLGATPQATYEAMGQDMHTQCCAHADGGSMVSTTHLRTHLWHYRDGLDHDVLLRVADDHAHSPAGMGYLKIPVIGSSGTIMFPCYYTPTMPATIISPDAIGRSLGYRGYQSISNFDGQDCGLRLLHRISSAHDTIVPLTLIRGLLYTEQLVLPVTESDQTLPYPEDRLPDTVSAPLSCATLKIMDVNRLSLACNGVPTFPDPSTVDPPASSLAPPTYKICHLARDQLCLLWHQRLGHLNFRRTSDLHRTTDGVPKIPIVHDLDTCPICLAAKLKRAARGLEDSRSAKHCNQGISIDTGHV
jgi:GAG-pre-integrase domain